MTTRKVREGLKCPDCSAQRARLPKQLHERVTADIVAHNSRKEGYVQEAIEHFLRLPKGQRAAILSRHPKTPGRKVKE